MLLLTPIKTLKILNFGLYSIFYQYLSSISIYKNGRTDVCLFVCLLVCGGLMEIQTPALILMKFARTSPPVQGRFSSRFDHPPLGLGGLKY